MPSVVEVWGSGKPLREFLWSEDMADACVYLMENVDFNQIVTPSSSRRVISSPTANSSQSPTTNRQPPITNTHINIGTGKEISIKDLAETIKEIVGFKGDLYFNTE